MNAESQPAAVPDFAGMTSRPRDAAASTLVEMPWLWQGILAPGKLTGLVSHTKSGKTTLASILYARMQTGGQLAGLPVAPGRTFIVSEESKDDWDARCARLGIERNIEFLCRPFGRARPRPEQWFALVDYLERVHRHAALDLVVMDPLATFLPGHAENSAPQLLDYLLPVQQMAQLGPAVLLMHHAGRGKRPDGLAARGTSALGGLVDIILEMSHFKRARSTDRRRHLHGYSRYSQTPRHLVIELDEAGTDYLVRTNAAGEVLVTNWPEVHAILSWATDKLTQQKIQEQWPVDADPPDRSTLLRWLTRATRQGVIKREGSGYRGNPFRYWLAEREPYLWPGNSASDAEKQAWRERCAAQYRK